MPLSLHIFSCHLILFNFLFSGLLYTDCNIIVSLASGVCPLMDEFVPEVCEGFLLGVTGSCPLVGGAESYPSVGRTMTKSVFVGGCWRRWLWVACLLMGGTVFSLCWCLACGMPALGPVGC